MLCLPHESLNPHATGRVAGGTCPGSQPHTCKHSFLSSERLRVRVSCKTESLLPQLEQNIVGFIDPTCRSADSLGF